MFSILLNCTTVNCQSKVKNIEYTIDSFNNQLFTVKDLKVKLKLKNNNRYPIIAPVDFSLSPLFWELPIYYELINLKTRRKVTDQISKNAHIQFHVPIEKEKGLILNYNDSVFIPNSLQSYHFRKPGWYKLRFVFKYSLYNPCNKDIFTKWVSIKCEKNLDPPEH